MPHDPSKIKGYLLTIKDNPVVVSGRHWQADEIYLNDVCMVVIVKPIAGEGNEQAAKEELYSLLRGISSRALCHNLMRPLAAIVKDAAAAPAIAAWGADQEWHRGMFTLYVEYGKETKTEAVPTAEELLDPELDILASTQFALKKAADILASIDSTKKSFEFRGLHGRLLRMLMTEEIAKQNDDAVRVQAVEAELESWRNEIDPDITGRR